MIILEIETNEEKTKKIQDKIKICLADKKISNEEKTLIQNIDIYLRETDKEKRAKLDEKIRDFILSNRDFIKKICYNSITQDIIYAFYEKEKGELQKELSEYRVPFNKLAVVSVNLNYWERSKWTKFEYNKPDYPPYAYDTRLDHNFKMGEVWEFALLSEDKKYFALFRDLPDKRIQPITLFRDLPNKRIQPISNCKIWKDATIAEIANNAPFDLSHEESGKVRKVYHENNIFPYDIFFEPWDAQMSTFDDDDIKNGWQVDDLYFDNLRRIKHQMNAILSKRSAKMEEDMKSSAFTAKHIMEL